MNLAFRGEEGIGRYVAEQYDKTDALLGADRGAPGLRVPQPAGVEHPLLPLRQRPGARRCRCASGCSPSERFHLSSTEVSGERWLRMTVTAPATSEATIEAMLDAIEELAGA